MDILSLIGANELRDMNIVKVGHRVKILDEIRKLNHNIKKDIDTNTNVVDTKPDKKRPILDEDVLDNLAPPKKKRRKNQT